MGGKAAVSVAVRPIYEGQVTIVMRPESDRVASGTDGRYAVTLSDDFYFFRRKIRIKLLTVATYAALC